MNVEIGDRVTIRHEQFPKDHMHNVGWADHPNGPGWGDPIEIQSSEHWKSAHGVIVAIDTLNDEVTVRGKHKGEDFTLIVPSDQVSITEMGVPR